MEIATRLFWQSVFTSGLRLQVAPADNAAMENQPSIVESPKRRRRWFQFSLRTLLIVTLIVAVGCAFLAKRIKRAWTQKTAVEAILGDGGVVWYDFEVNAQGNRVAGAECPGPAWIRKVLGNDLFTNVVYVEAKTDSALKQIGKLSEVQGLALMNSQVTDDGLEHLEGLTKLKWINLNITSISDAGLEHLKRLPSLTSLMVWRTRMTDGGLASFEIASPNCRIWRGQ